MICLFNSQLSRHVIEKTHEFAKHRGAAKA